VAAFLAELGQILIALTLSVGVALLIKLAYVIVATVVATACVALLVQHAHEQLLATPVREEQPQLAKKAVSSVITAVWLGALWPALPVIFVWGAARERARALDD